MKTMILPHQIEEKIKLENIVVTTKTRIENKEEQVEQTIDELFDLLRSTIHRNFSPPPLGRLWASSSGYCLRKYIASKSPEWLLLDNLKEIEEDPHSLGNFKVGELIHGILTETIDAKPYKFFKVDNTERYIKYIDNDPETGYQYEITGMYDISFRVPANGKLEIIVGDWKTFKAIRSWKTKQISEKYMAKLAHFQQVSVYAASLGGLDAVILYLTRNEGELHPIGLGWDNPDFKVKCSACDLFHKLPEEGITGELLWELTNEMAKLMVKCENEYFIPSRDPYYTEESWECNNICPYQDLCFNIWGNDEYYGDNRQFVELTVVESVEEEGVGK